MTHVTAATTTIHGPEYDTAIPPAEIRYRVASSEHSVEEFVRIGRDSASVIEEAAQLIGGLGDSRAVLDFGCGCGRVVQHIHARHPHIGLTGTDIDPVGVEWARANLSGGMIFDINEPMPPLRYADAQFDLIYALSVFSHLDDEMQTAWLEELARILRPGGLLFFSFNGQHVVDAIAPTLSDTVFDGLETRGFHFLRNIGDGVLPEWYQTSLQTSTHLERGLASAFSMVRHKPRAMGGWQDAMIAVRR